jgi:arabinose-5-phosphate isomerase
MSLSRAPAESAALNDANLLDSARNVLTAESAALKIMAEQINGDFVKAVRILVACKGRVVVSGMGKSGHIARKIAATLASTGTPALFVHPGEASHGDLGMIVPEDAVIAISNSGETAELTDLVAYTRRFSIPLICITKRAQSALGQAADVLLLLPQEPEVGALGLAPTTSTTMALALGDALAVAVLECKGFTADDFHNFHPGGKLGKTLQRVADVMHGGNELPLAGENDIMAHVLVVMTEKRFGCAGIVNSVGDLTGIITDGDLRRHMGNGITEKRAVEVMTKGPMVVAPRLLAAEALKILNDTKRTQLFVVDDGKPVGILHIHDLLAAGIA